MPKRPPKDRLVFPNALRHARKAAGFHTQVAFAEKCGVHPETVGQYERGDRPPSEYTVTPMVDTLRDAHLPDADLAALEKAAEQDRRTWDAWDVEPTDAPANGPELLPHPRRDPRPSLHNLPFQRNPFFTGQEQLLEQLHHELTPPGSQMALSQAISGLGGMGKTELALEYVYRYQNDYSTVFWITAYSSEALQADLGRLARDLGLPYQSDKDQNWQVPAVRRWLSESANWLLILDNVDDLRLVTPTATSFLPPSHHGAVLLTTQMQVTEPVALAIQVEPMPDAGGALLLLRRTKQLLPDALLQTVSADEHPSPVSADELRDAHELSRLLGGLPLALDQAGAYILEKGTTLAHYLSLYKQRYADLLQKRGSAPSAHPESVTTTFALAFARLQQKNAAAAEILKLCAFLGPEPIPEGLICPHYPTPEPLTERHLGAILLPVASDPIAFDEAIEALRSLALIQRDVSKAEISVHRLVQAVLADQMSEAMQRDCIGRCVRLLNVAFPTAQMRSAYIVSTWGLPPPPKEDAWCNQLVPHVLTICGETAWETAPIETETVFQSLMDYKGWKYRA